jgi:hypothetical protein
MQEWGAGGAIGRAKRKKLSENGRKRFFFEKKKQKTSDSCGLGNVPRQMLL